MDLEAETNSACHKATSDEVARAHDGKWTHHRLRHLLTVADHFRPALRPALARPAVAAASPAPRTSTPQLRPKPSHAARKQVDARHHLGQGSLSNLLCLVRRGVATRWILIATGLVARPVTQPRGHSSPRAPVHSARLSVRRSRCDNTDELSGVSRLAAVSAVDLCVNQRLIWLLRFR